MNDTLTSRVSGIAVTTVGNSAPRVIQAVAEQAAAFTHTCFMVTPFDGYMRLTEELSRLTRGDHAKRTALFESHLAAGVVTEPIQDVLDGILEEAA